ncbi:MAG: hypothetical protein BWY66_02513 [bacterium ADurb.Bin374]|nr:MAG: hypothetical protein BWY66_02513 [bacterium ADurb.Bin374]
MLGQERGGVDVAGRIVQDDDAVRLPENGAGLVGGHGVRQFDVNRLAVSVEYGHTDRRDADRNGRFQDFPCLADHLLFFAAHARIEENVDVREQIEPDRVRIYAFRNRFAGQHRAALGFQGLDRFEAGSGNRLVGRDDDAFDRVDPVNRRDRDDHLDGGTVGVRYNTARYIIQGVRIHLGHDQRNIGVHAERVAVVDHDRTGRGRPGAPCPADLGAGREKDGVEAGKVCPVERLDLDLAAGERKLDAFAAFRCEQPQAARDELALLQHLQDGVADGAGGAYDTERWGLHTLISLKRSLPG